MTWFYFPCSIIYNRQASRIWNKIQQIIFYVAGKEAFHCFCASFNSIVHNRSSHRGIQKFFIHFNRLLVYFILCIALLNGEMNSID